MYLGREMFGPIIESKRFVRFNTVEKSVVDEA